MEDFAFLRARSSLPASSRRWDGRRLSRGEHWYDVGGRQASAESVAISRWSSVGRARDALPYSATATVRGARTAFQSDRGDALASARMVPANSSVSAK